MGNNYTKEFYDAIFMGNCNPGSTEANILKLYKLVDKCITEVGGLQQPPRPNSEDDAKAFEKEYKNGQINVKAMVGDIAMALTGKQIYFKEDVNRMIREALEGSEHLSGLEDCSNHPDDSEEPTWTIPEPDQIKATAKELHDALVSSPIGKELVNFAKYALNEGKKVLDEVKDKKK